MSSPRSNVERDGANVSEHRAVVVAPESLRVMRIQSVPLLDTSFSITTRGSERQERVREPSTRRKASFDGSNTWEVDLDDLNNTLWITPSERDATQPHIQEICVRMGPDGKMGFAFKVKIYFTCVCGHRRRRTRRSQRRRLDNDRADSGAKISTNDNSHQRQGKTGRRKRRKTKQTCQCGLRLRRSQSVPEGGLFGTAANVVQIVTLQDVLPHSNPYLSTDTAEGTAFRACLSAMPAHPALRYINGCFVDSKSTLLYTLDAIRAGHLKKVAAAKLEGSSAESVCTMVRLGFISPEHLDR